MSRLSHEKKVKAGHRQAICGDGVVERSDLSEGERKDRHL
jgi:hypothetical protein